MTCPYCGTPLVQGSNTCAKCGAQYTPPSAATYTQPQQPAEEPGKGLALAAMITGITSLATSYLCVGFIVGIIALILGLKAKAVGSKSGKAKAGIICGAVGIGLNILAMIIVAVYLVLWLGLLMAANV